MTVSILYIYVIYISSNLAQSVLSVCIVYMRTGRGRTRDVERTEQDDTLVRDWSHSLLFAWFRILFFRMGPSHLQTMTARRFDEQNACASCDVDLYIQRMFNAYLIASCSPLCKVMQSIWLLLFFLWGKGGPSLFFSEGRGCIYKLTGHDLDSYHNSLECIYSSFVNRRWVGWVGNK